MYSVTIHLEFLITCILFSFFSSLIINIERFVSDKDIWILNNPRLTKFKMHYNSQQTNQNEHHLRNHPAASPSQRNFRKSSLKSQKATRRILDGPSMPSGRDPPPSFSTGHVRYNTPEENLPTILITAEDLHLNFPTNDMSASPSPPKSPRQEGVVSPAARPKTASSGRASSGRSSRRAHSAKQSKRPASSRSPGRSKERGGQGDRKGSRERRGKPIPAWSVTELLDDDSTTMGGSETHSEYEMSLSSVQTPTGKHQANQS